MNKQEYHMIPEKDRRNAVLEGIAYYTSLHQPNPNKSPKHQGEPYFIVNLGLDDPSMIARAKGLGLTIHDPENGIPMPFVKLKRKLSMKALKAGEDIMSVKPELVDTAQNPIPPTVLVGNGSRVRCKFGTYWYDTNGGGVNASLYKVMVIHLIPYTKVDKDFSVPSGGFVVGGTTGNDPLADFFDDEEQPEVVKPAKAKKTGTSSSKSIFDE